MATTKKKPSAAQLAARKLFAQRAKAGTLRKKTATKKKPAVKRAKNPTPKVVARPAINRRDSRRRELAYFVQSRKEVRDEWVDIAACRNIHVAKLLAETFAEEHPDHYVRVET